ncbi:unnamed protein product [Cylindrotheca closterium]|uniref:Plastid lipid-associated protein/fibrillin conserved domain-containing protein n=1 Tax=Cylindrotheca closterium TaxID=2856 RepID=A0AAD2CST5_9STRA|nr:unnamed protein product [Cylindrotheca closterium]
MNTLHSRRSVLGVVIGSMLLPSVVSSSPAFAEDAANGTTPTFVSTGAAAARENLLSAIQQGKPDAEVLAAIDRLKPFNPLPPTSSTAAKSLEGEWRLLWSINDDFSPLLRLPKPFKPNSFQYFGPIAAAEVGEGRVAQGLTSGLLGNSQLWLSSGTEPLPYKTVESGNAPYRLEIEPPFRFQLGGRLGTNQPKRMIVEAGNDADFRKVNARTKEAQLAGKNVYEQIYVESKGKGSLRISTITEGDPAIIGTILIHEKM